jgi:23S rRNA (uridine2552-2'-O)-methyltransferase
MDDIPGATVIAPADFNDLQTIELVQEAIGAGRAIHVVLSDMAPNTTGQPGIDHVRIMELAESVRTFAIKNLVPGGSCLIKLYEQNRVWISLITHGVLLFT